MRIKRFNEGFMDIFKKNKSVETTKKTTNSNSTILIDESPYEESQFRQEKYGVYIQMEDGRKLYIGDLRKFKSDGKYLSYIWIDRSSIKDIDRPLIEPNDDQLNIINSELDKNYLSRNLMDDTITYRDKLKYDYNIIL